MQAKSLNGKEELSMWINGRFIPLMDADSGANPQGGSAGSGDTGDDGGAGDSGDGKGSDDGAGTDSKLEELRKQVEQMKTEHQKELDKYRNEKGHLKKELEKLKQEGMSEEEKLEQERQQLEEEKRQLKVDRLNAHKAAQVAEQGLDKRLAEYIDVDAEMSREQVTSAIEDLKNVQSAMREEIINELRENGSVINSGGNRDNGGQNKKSSFGKELAEKNSKNTTSAAEGQKHYFKNS
jgi:hypothetical protein